MFELSVSKDMKNKNNTDNKKIPTYILAYLPALIVKELKIGVE